MGLCLNIWLSFFEMVAMPFPCNGLLLCCVNIPAILLVFFNEFAFCSIPYFNLFLYFTIITIKTSILSSNMIHQKKKKKEN